MNYSETGEKKFHILIAHYRPDIVSGAENSIADFTDLAARNFDITMLVPGEGNLAQFYRQRGFTVWIKKVETPRRLLPGLHQVQSILLANELKQRGVDAVLCNTFPAASRVSTASRIARIPHAIYMRDYIKDTPLHRRMLQQASAVFAISNDVKSRIAAMVDPRKIYLTYNYINPDPILDRFDAHRASGASLLPFNPAHPVIGLVGRITPYKQPDLFIRAVPHVLSAVPKARFVLVGSAQAREKAYEDSLRQLANDLSVQGKVSFLGLRKDAVELTSEFTVACLTSGHEPLGRVILEAHLLQVPVVVPDTGGPAEIVVPEVTGLRFSSVAADAEIQLANQIIRLLKEPELASCLADKALEHVMTTFASQKHVTIQEQYIEQLCKQQL
jgi:glycosyltransferase involved in cell wall biosynthesis